MINRLKSAEEICCSDFGIDYIKDNGEALKYYITHSLDEMFILRAFQSNDIITPLKLVFKHANLKLIRQLSSKVNIFIVANSSDVFNIFSRFDYNCNKKISQWNGNIPFTFFKREVVKSACYRGYDLKAVGEIAKEIGYVLNWHSEKDIISSLIYEKSPFVGVLAKSIGWEAILSITEAYRALSSLTKKELIDIGFKLELATPSPIKNESFEETIKKVNYETGKLINGMY